MANHCLWKLPMATTLFHTVPLFSFPLFWCRFCGVGGHLDYFGPLPGHWGPWNTTLP